MFKKLKYLLSLILFFAIPVGLNSEQVINTQDDIIDTTNLSELTENELSELAIKAKRIATILESYEKIKNLKDVKVKNKKLLLLLQLKNGLVNNFIVDGVKDGVKDGLKDIIKTVVVPTTLITALALATLSSFTGISFLDLTKRLWNIVFTSNSSSPSGPNDGYYDTAIMSIIKAWNAMPWVG